MSVEKQAGEIPLEERAKAIIDNFMHKPTYHSNPEMIWREHITDGLREAVEAAKRAQQEHDAQIVEKLGRQSSYQVITRIAAAIREGNNT